MCQEEVRAPIEHDRRLFCPVEDCPHEYATEVGYKTRSGYVEHYRRYHLQSEKVVLTSRIDWGSPGFRRGELELALAISRLEEAEFVNLAGGLISYPHLKDQLTSAALDDLWAEKWGSDYTRKRRPARKERIARAKDWRLNQWADELARVLPQLKIRGRYVKIYIVTSPASNYDGKIGAEVARRLAERRPDIRFWGEESARFRLKRQATVFWTLTPRKASWRSEYFSTAVDRLIKDKERQTSESLPDLWVVGCTASALQRPRGERKRPYASVPALHRLGEVHTAENQVGVTVVEFLPPTNSERAFLVRNYSLKDPVAGEFRAMPSPLPSFELGQRVIAVLREQPATLGELEDILRVPRKQIAAEIERLNASTYEPKVVLRANSEYRFSPDWIRNDLRYGLPPRDGLVEDTLLAFACLHASSPYTEYRFFLEEVPKLILQHRVQTLVGAGDFIQGLEHDLDKRGEVILGLNYTQQEYFAAKLVGEVLLHVFRERFRKALPKPSKSGKPRVNRPGLQKLIEASLVSFLYQEGNHDAWLKRRGVTPLTTFHATLVETLNGGVEKSLMGYDLQPPTSIREIVRKKVQRGEQHTLPSGLGLTIYHPHMSRAKTCSLRIQQMLEKSDSPIVIGGNFHVAIATGQWESELGQRLGLQVGTILWMSEHEDKQLKNLDTGVAVARILSYKGRVYMTETLFSNEGVQRETHTNEGFLGDFLKQLNVS